MFYHVTYEFNQWKLYVQKMLLKRSKKWSRNNQKKYGQTRDQSSKEISKNFVKRKEFIYIQQNAKPSRHLQRGTFDRLKTSFTNIWKKSGLGHILKIYPFVNTINSRVNRVTHLAPNKVFKKHEPILISLAINTTKYKPKLQSTTKNSEKVINKIIQTKFLRFSKLLPWVHQRTIL